MCRCRARWQKIDWGDGTTPASISATATTAVYTYTAAGTYTVVLTLTDSASRIATKSSQIVIAAATPPAPELFFSEYVQGSSNNKALEVFNPTAGAIDLSQYAIRVYFNGATTSTNVTLSGTLSASSVYVITNSSGTASLTVTASLLINGGVMNFHGNDAITLEKNGIVIDRFGQMGLDPGTGWGTTPNTTDNRTWRRKSAITIGDTAASTAFDPAAQWDVFPQDTFNGLGTR